MNTAAMQDITSVSRTPTTSAPRLPKPEAGSEAFAALDWSDKLAIGNRQAAAELMAKAEQALSNPLSLLKERVEGMVAALSDPLAPFEHALEAARHDVLDGGIRMIQAASGAVAIGTLVVGAAALVAAPFTGGASLAVLPAVGAAAQAAGAVGLASAGAELVRHEVGMATADSSRELTAHASGAALAMGTLGEAAVTHVAGKAVSAIARTGKATFHRLISQDPDAIWSPSTGARTREALAAFKRGEVGSSVKGLDLRGMSPEAMQAELAGRGFQKQVSHIKDFRTREALRHPQTGQPIPMEIWTHPDGGMVRVKPLGDPTSKFRPQPHASVSVNFPPGSSPHDFNNEAFKLDFKGNALPKWGKDAQLPFGAETKASKEFLDALASRTHMDL